MMKRTTVAAVMACLVSMAPAQAAPPTQERDSPAAGAQEDDRRYGVVRPAPPSCSDDVCDRTKAFRFKGGHVVLTAPPVEVAVKAQFRRSRRLYWPAQIFL